jgi:Dolichyl-phosphate-mannose-protein mannosyltransferase
VQRLRAWPTASRLIPETPPKWAPAAVVAAAAALRLELFLNNRSFWLDESLLGLNLLDKTAYGLFHSLDYVQSAPAGFLLAEKGALDLFGASEQTLRLLPLLCSLGCLAVFWPVARRLVSTWAALIALILFAVNSTVLYQSSEAKPYSGDVFAALLLMWLTLRILEAPSGRLSVRGHLPLTIAGAALVSLSYPSVIVLGSCYCALLARTRLGRAALAPLISGALVGASAFGAYVVSSRSIATVHQAVFVGDPHASSRLEGTARAAWFAVSDPGGFAIKLRALALVCLVVGVVATALRGPSERALLLLLPLALAGIAAVVNAYPLGGRWSLFLVPILTVLFAAGAVEILGSSRRPVLIGIPLLALLLGVPVGAALGKALNPPSRENVRPLLQQLDRSWQSGDTLYVYRNAQYALRFYGECRYCGVPAYPFRLRDAAPGALNEGFPAALASAPPTVTVGVGERTPAASLRDLNALRGRRRLWLLFSHVASAAPNLGEDQFFLAHLDTFGRRLSAWYQPGAALYLYDTR